MDLSGDREEERPVPWDQYRQGALQTMVRGDNGQGAVYVMIDTLCNVAPLTVTLLPFLITLVTILVSLCLLILCITQVIKRSRLKYDEVNTYTMLLIHQGLHRSVL